MMKNSTLEKLSLSELKSKHRVLGRMLYLVGASTLVCILIMLYSIIKTSGIGVLNLVLGGLAIGLTVYLYRLSNQDTRVYEEMWTRKYHLS